MSAPEKLPSRIVQPINAHAGALWAARKGLRVLRVQPNGKDPYEKGKGVKEATTNEATINAWFAKEPRLNYGIAMGGPQNLVTLDCDKDKPNFHADYLSLCHPCTLEFESRSGGAHIILRVPFAASQRKLAGATSIDVRAGGGYIVGPGSVVDGKRYSIVEDAPIADCPDAIAARLGRDGDKTAGDTGAVYCEPDQPANVERAAAYLKGAAPAIEGENGDDRTYAVAAKLKNLGVSEPTALGLMLELWNDRCDPPWEPEALETKVANAYAYSQDGLGRDSLDGEFEDLSADPDLVAWQATRQAKQTPKPATPADLLEHASDVRLDEIIALQSTALVKGVLLPGDAAVLYGESTAGKSFVALDMAWHIAMGKPWHGKKVNKAPVLYVALEGVSGFRKRMLAALKVHGDPGAWFARLKLPVSLVRATAGKEGMTKIIEAAKQLQAKTGQPVGAIIVDTFARAISGDDENSADDTMHFVNDRAGAIARATGAAVLTVAHSNRGGDLRGSLHMRNAQDAVLRVERKKSKEGDAVNADGQVFRTVEAEKVKDGEEGMLFSFALEQVQLGPDEDGEPITSCVVRSAKNAPAAEGANDSGAQKEYRTAYKAVADKQGSTDVPLADVREAFIEAHSTDRKDPKEVAKVKRDAWNHARKKPPGGLEVYAKEGADWVRPIRPKGRRGVTDPHEEFEAIGDVSGLADSSDYDFG